MKIIRITRNLFVKILEYVGFKREKFIGKKMKLSKIFDHIAPFITRAGYTQRGLRTYIQVFPNFHETTDHT